MDALPPVSPSEDDVFETIGSSNLDLGKYYVLLSSLREGDSYSAEVMLVAVEDEWRGPNGERQGVWYRRCRMLSMETGDWVDMPAEEPRRYAPLGILLGPEVPFEELPQGESWHVMRFCVF